ncbi:pectinesterase-like [Tasmannia lanceolata]|uniref:pectinesterase-like n=1 Tax=Tasmannia lanceolata TaxID=3420 RepID=UPI004062F099
MVVAKDGSGNYTKVSEAIVAAPIASTRRFVIYIKAGIYVESVLVGSEKANITFIGDGMNKTIITSNVRSILTATLDAKLDFDSSHVYQDVNHAIQSELVHRGNLIDLQRILVKNGQVHLFLNASVAVLCYRILVSEGSMRCELLFRSSRMNILYNSEGGTAVLGVGFTARDLTIENSAGPEKGQAVALRSESDLSGFYRCSFKGFQDTLFAKEGKQFYRECEIYGTVDFIFGDASVVFQNCMIYLHKPPYANVIVAQGRSISWKNSGTSIHNCTIRVAPDLKLAKSSYMSFLGRPWKEYSRTIIMESSIDDLIDPAGWTKWNDSSFGLSTCYYREYKNRGPGADIGHRVKWPGYKVTNNPDEALNFTVKKFLDGENWIPWTGIPFTSGLIS